MSDHDPETPALTPYLPHHLPSGSDPADIVSDHENC
jgi:hypothetical protein